MIEVNSPLFSKSTISLKTEENSLPLPRFYKNEIVKGKVLKSSVPREALLLIKGRKVMARTHASLGEGKVLSLMVEEISPIPVFKLIGAKSANYDTINISMILSAMKENLWESVFENMNQSVFPKEDSTLFRELIKELSMKLFLKPSPDLLRVLIDKSGIGWETKLRKLFFQKTVTEDSLNGLIKGDLKGMGSKLLSFNKEKEGAVNRFVNAIKNIQLLNSLGIEHERKIFLPVPLLFSNGEFSLGQLLIKTHREKKKEQEIKECDKVFFNLTFLLELSNIGPLRADLSIRGKEINGRFLLVNEEAKLLIEKNLTSLVDNLKEKGFSFRNIDCQIKDSEIIKDTLIKEVVQEEDFNINLVA